MTFGKLKETDMYADAEDIRVFINDDEIDEEGFYIDEICLLDTLPVIGTGHFSNGILQVDLVCSNWDQRFDEDWIPEPFEKNSERLRSW